MKLDRSIHGKSSMAQEHEVYGICRNMSEEVTAVHESRNRAANDPGILQDDEFDELLYLLAMYDL